MKNEDKIVELLTDLVQKQDQLIERMDSKEVADQRRFEAIDKRFENIDKRFEAIDKRLESMDKRFGSIEGELKENNRILTSVAHVVSSLVINHQAAYVELSEKIRRLEEKVYGQAS